MHTYELNIDGLVGPSHHYAGLSIGNIASTNNALSVANPQAAALQGLDKMRFLHRLGLKQAVMPPHQRPNLHLLRQLGFNGSPHEQLNNAKSSAPALLSAAYSAASMWVANAATISSSLDTLDKRVHFTAANLISNIHRQQEADFSRALLQHIFPDEKYFSHHPILPQTLLTRDEGAANHNRLCESHGHHAINLFVYGKQQLSAHFPARQTLEASQAIARSHLLNLNDVIFACQNPIAIDKGVFHNDVICVANESVLFIHQDAFIDQTLVLNQLKDKATFDLQIIEVSRDEISIDDAVKSYLFNSQLLTISPNNMVLIAAIECEEHPSIKAYLERLVACTSNPITHVYFFDLRQSMRNGGGPACLRLRVPLNEAELSAMHQGVAVCDELIDALENWVRKHYRCELNATDLNDPYFMNECFTALDTLTPILKLGSIYPFQQR